MRILTTLLVLIALVAACGSDSESDEPSSTAPIEVGEVLDGDSGDVSVIGYVVIDANGARLCEVLAESFPPQCGGASIVISNPDALTVALETEQDTQWTNERVTLDGSYDGTELTLDG